jgi:hypothetical protein
MLAVCATLEKRSISTKFMHFKPICKRISCKQVMFNTDVQVYHTTAKEEASKENITFRLDKALLDRLRFEAEERKTSVNAIAQSIFSTHYKWTAGASKAGMIPIHKTMLAMFLDKFDDEDLVQTAKLFADLRAKDMTLILRNNYNLVAFLDVLESWMGVSSVSFDKTLSDGIYRYVISHEVGSKWSAFLSLMLQSIFKKMGVTDVSFEVTDGTIMFSVPKLLLRVK